MSQINNKTTKAVIGVETKEVLGITRPPLQEFYFIKLKVVAAPANSMKTLEILCVDFSGTDTAI